MRSGHPAPANYAMADSGPVMAAFLRRGAARAGGEALLGFSAFAVAALATWNVADPSFSHATSNPVTNAAGYAGAVFSDLAMQFFGIGAVAALVPAIFWGVILATGRTLDRPMLRGLAWFAAAVFGSAAIACVPTPQTWPLPLGLGGVFGDLVLKAPKAITGAYPHGLTAVLSALVLLPLAAAAFLYATGLVARPDKAVSFSDDRFDAEDDFDGDDGGYPAFGILAHWYYSAQAFVRRHMAKRTDVRPAAAKVSEPRAASAAQRMPMQRAEPSFGGDDFAETEDFGDFDDDDDGFDAPVAFAAEPARALAARRVEQPAARPKPGARLQREAQASLIRPDHFEMPPLHFLSEPKNVVRDASLSKDALEQNARMLEGVLDDFGVKGEIIHVRPGPVVTLYELEPAPGIKSSRVIGLADDIARSMSAIAARVAVVPGRNAIGIELPNSTRETVYLREILASRDYETSKARLGLALGKTINGEAVIVDLAKMPHVLVAGTTGSGKSVAINTMILSLVYKMTPAECRLIMIDPKMLELSVYDGIPHLLTPVVTDPKKAVVALKWTVREMEDRYRKMSKVGVRNIDGFNARVAEAAKSGEKITRTVQTGFDRGTGEAIYETEELDLRAIPYIVVIIDEMADLMMVAGKDIEGAVQRLAQMARAAGIHVIMATQRPSVDVITGTIKANFPTRISFQVTSKIDSRTILGEQGAEQLLGMGDMLYMAGGGRIQRVHGPFVSDSEVEKIVQHLKLQGAPEYLDAITEDDEDDDDGAASGVAGVFEDSDDPYDQAVAVVLRDGKASTSYIQRRLGIGYNRAASIIERMEKDGIVGAANHAGKREILVPTEDDKM